METKNAALEMLTVITVSVEIAAIVAERLARRQAAVEYIDAIIADRAKRALLENK